MTFIRILLLLALSLVPTHGRAAYGGFAVHTITTYPTANFPGRTVSCFTSGAVGPCSVGYSAACDGVTDDSPALATMVAAMVASNPTPQAVIIDPGKKCTFASNNTFFWDGSTENTPIADLVIWAYGASVSTSLIGAFGLYDDGKNALFQTSQPGDCTINLVNAGNSSKFTVGDSVMVGNLVGATFGNPPTDGVTEFPSISSIVGGAITVSPCLANGYKSTYPAAVSGTGITDPYQGGPATIWRLHKQWNTKGQVYGLTVLSGQTIISGRGPLFLKDVSFPKDPAFQSPAPSSSPSIAFFNVTVGGTMEIDKNIGLLDMSNSTFFQTSSASYGNKVVFTNSTVTGALIGTDADATLNNTKIADGKVGPLNASGGILRLNNTTFTALSCAATFTPATNYTFSAGTFTVPYSADLSSTLATFYPGRSVYFGDSDGTNNSVPYTHFKVTNMRQDATNTYIDTDIVGALPVPTCNSHSCPVYVAAQVSTVVNNNSTAPILSGNTITCPSGANTIPIP